MRYLKKEFLLKRKFNVIILYIFLFFAILTPRDQMNLKKFFFLFLLIINSPVIIYSFKLKKFRFVSFFSTLYPVIPLTFSVILGMNLISVIRKLYVFVYLYIIYILKHYKINFIKAFIHILNLMAFIIVLGASLDFLNILNIYQNPIFRYLHFNGEAAISKSRFAIFYYVIFLKASPLLLFSLSYYINKKNIKLSTLSFLALIFTGTRSNIYLAIFIIFFSIIFIEKNEFKKIFFVIGVIILLLFFGKEFYDRISTINWAKSSGDNIRYLHFQTLSNLVTNNFRNLLIGTGINSEYYSVARDKYVNNSELAYFELFRQMGIIGFGLFIYFLLKPLRKLWLNQKTKWIFLAYSCYLTLGLINPLIFTSTSFLAYAVVYYVYVDLV